MVCGVVSNKTQGELQCRKFNKQFRTVYNLYQIPVVRGEVLHSSTNSLQLLGTGIMYWKDKFEEETS
jgi:hypothetical protein